MRENNDMDVLNDLVSLNVKDFFPITEVHFDELSTNEFSDISVQGETSDIPDILDSYLYVYGFLTSSRQNHLFCHSKKKRVHNKYRNLMRKNLKRMRVL